MCGGNGIVVYLCVSVCLLSLFLLCTVVLYTSDIVHVVT